MEQTPDFRISRNFKSGDELRKVEGLQCIEWNIENFNTLLQEKRLECLTSPTFQMRGATWNLSLHLLTRKLYLLQWKTEKRQHSFTYLVTVKNSCGICWSALETFSWDESGRLVFDRFIIGNLDLSSITGVSFLLLPEVKQSGSESDAREAMYSNTINPEGRSETTENLVEIISPSLEMESIGILPGCRIDDNFRIIDGLLYIDWNIKNFKLLGGKQPDLVTSPPFKMRGAWWNLVLKHTENVVSPMLNRCSSASESKPHSIACQISIQSKGTIYRGDLKTFLFDKSKCIGDGISITLESLFDDRTTDNLRIFCIVFPEDLKRTSEATSESDVRGVETCSNSSHEGIDILVSNIKDLFLSEENCDFVIKVKDRDFHVHRAILAVRSPVLSRMLQHDMAEKNSGSVDIVDCEPDVFEYFLRYLYTGCVEELSWSHVIHLYTLGDKYDMPHLRKECLQFMEGNLSIEAFCDAIAFAVKHRESTLVKRAEEFFLENVESILVTNNWQLLMADNPVICNELYLKYAKKSSTK